MRDTRLQMGSLSASVGVNALIFAGFLLVGMGADEESKEEVEYIEAEMVELVYYTQCYRRNLRYLLTYFLHRLKKMRELRWETGTVLPEALRQETLCKRELLYFNEYVEAMIRLSVMRTQGGILVLALASPLVSSHPTELLDSTPPTHVVTMAPKPWLCSHCEAPWQVLSRFRKPLSSSSRTSSSSPPWAASMTKRPSQGSSLRYSTPSAEVPGNFLIN